MRSSHIRHSSRLVRLERRETEGVRGGGEGRERRWKRKERDGESKVANGGLERVRKARIKRKARISRRKK